MTEQTAYEPKIIAFLCNWCSYAGADLAGTSRTQYPPNIRVIRVMCSARIEPLFVLKALLEGADGVLLSGCHIGDCHYLKGNYAARRRYAVFVELMGYTGIDPERFQMSWVSASEGAKFGKVVADFAERVSRLGPKRRLELPRALEGLLEGGDAE